MQNSDCWTSVRVSMGPRHDLSFCACTTAGLTSDLLFSMGPSPLQWFCIQNSVISIRITSLYGFRPSSVVLSTHYSVLSTRINRQYGFQPSSVVLCMQTATLALDLLVSIGPSPHLRFLHANQRLLDQNCMSLWVPNVTCDFVYAKQRA